MWLVIAPRVPKDVLYMTASLRILDCYEGSATQVSNIVPENRFRNISRNLTCYLVEIDINSKKPKVPPDTQYQETQDVSLELS
jgi:hypothetical protein